MNVVDIVIIAILILYILKGFGNGVLKELVSCVGGLAVLVLAFLLKNPVSVFMYQNLPFFKITGILSGISVINIIIYELIAFLLIATILLIVYQILLKVTNIIDKILKITIIFELPSKLLGALVGFVEGVIVTFILLFVFMQFDFTRTYINGSKYSHVILEKTPFLGGAVSPVYDSLKEIYDVADNYKNQDDKDVANLESLEILLKYKVITPGNAQILVESGKLNIEGAEVIIEKYVVS